MCIRDRWGAIFTLSVAHLGKYTSVASGVFMIGVVGGAILPLLQGVLADVLGYKLVFALHGIGIIKRNQTVFMQEAIFCGQVLSLIHIW